MVGYSIWFEKSTAYLHEVLKPFLGKFVVVYFDDIFTFSMKKDKYLSHLLQVLERLKEDNLFINLKKKCTFMQEDLVYSGFMASQEGLEMDLEKVMDIVKWTILKNTFDAISFHGLVSFYRNFI